MRGIAKRTDVSVAWERLYSGVALDLAQRLLGRISCRLETHSWQGREGRSPMCLGRLFPGIFGILVSVLRGISYIQSE